MPRLCLALACGPGVDSFRLASLSSSEQSLWRYSLLGAREGKGMASFTIRPRSYGSSEYEIIQDEKLRYVIRSFGAWGTEVALFDAAAADSRLMTAKKHGVFSNRVDISSSTDQPVTVMEHGRLIHINTFEFNGRSYRWKPKLGLKYTFKLLEESNEAPLATLKSKYPLSIGGECTLVVTETCQDQDWLHLLLLTGIVGYKQARAKANRGRVVPVY